MPQAGPPAAPWLPTAPEQEGVLGSPLEGHRIHWEDGAAGSSTSTAQSCPVPASHSLGPFCHPDSWQHRRGVAGSLLQRLSASARLTSGRDRPLLWAVLGTGVWSSIRPPPLQASSTASRDS